MVLCEISNCFEVFVSDVFVVSNVVSCDFVGVRLNVCVMMVGFGGLGGSRLDRISKVCVLRKMDWVVLLIGRMCRIIGGLFVC